MYCLPMNYFVSMVESIIREQQCCVISPLSLFSPERLAVRVCVLEAHLFQLAATVELVVPSVRLLSEILHVHTQQHLPQLHEITMVFILH